MPPPERRPRGLARPLAGTEKKRTLLSALSARGRCATCCRREDPGLQTPDGELERLRVAQAVRKGLRVVHPLWLGWRCRHAGHCSRGMHAAEDGRLGDFGAAGASRAGPARMGPIARRSRSGRDAPPGGFRARDVHVRAQAFRPGASSKTTPGMSASSSSAEAACSAALTQTRGIPPFRGSDSGPGCRSWKSRAS